MKKSRLFSTLLFALCCALMLGCIFAAEPLGEELSPAMKIWEKVDNGEMGVMAEQPELLYVTTNLAELEKNTDYIVKGKFRGDSEQDIQKYPSGMVGYGCTITSFDVTEVIMGEDLLAGDVIWVGESYYIDDEGLLQTYYNCMPAETGKEYIMFLYRERNPESRFYDIYTSVDFEKGRYPVEPPSDLEAASNRSLDLGNGSSKTYKSIYAEVIEKYLS